MTPLHLACAHRKAGAVRLLLQTSASAESELGRRDYLDLSARPSGQTGAALGLLGERRRHLRAVAGGPPRQLRRLLEKIRCRTRDLPALRPLSTGSRRGGDVVCRKAHFVNATNTAEQTPLHLAAELVTFGLWSCWCSTEPKLDAVDATGPTCWSGPRDGRRSSLDCRDREGNTPLMLASTEKDDPECARLLLAKGASPLCTDGQGRTAVYLATHWYNRQVLQALLDHPAVRDARIIDESDAANNSPLHVACRNGHVDIVELLLENGADAEAKNEDEETPMHLAAQAGHLQVVRRLLKINLSLAFDEDEDSNTPMHMAALAGQARICQLLIEEGKADVNARNSRGWTALDCAASKGFT
uniref:ANK_REP_REGION domain-containing protein n=1 Tax=Macrostomum lignano TaxID=282301 RepID=A0A1I8F9J1_9PLAT